jgi:hypothetical protein
MSVTTVVLCSSFPCEIGAAVMYNVLDEKSDVVAMTVANSKDFSKTISLIDKVCRQPKNIIMLGTYWADILREMLEHYESTTFTLYCFGEELNMNADNLSQFSGINGVGPTKFLLDLAEPKCSAKLFTLFVNKFTDVLRYIDDRIYNKNIMENQIFYTGLFNTEPIEMPLFDKFTNLFTGCYDLPTIMAIGRTIVSAQMGMARERATNNSKKVILQNNVTAVVTEGPDLINLTHDALHQKYPDSAVTIVMNMKFGEKDYLAYSIRAFDESISAMDMAKKINGDGNRSAAGGRITFEFPIPF